MINIILDAILGWLIDIVQFLYDGIFSSSLTDILDTFSQPDALKATIPYIDVLYNALRILGWVFLLLCAYSIIIKAIADQFGGDGSTENPLKSIGKLMIAAALIALEADVFSLVGALFSRMKGLMPQSALGVADTDIWFSLSGITIIVRCVLVAMFAFAAIGAAITFVERILSFVIFLYTYPLAIAFSVKKETSDMFRQWLVGIISQMILIVMSSGMLYIAINMWNLAVGFDWKSGISHAIADHITTINVLQFVLATAAMNLVKNSEKILNMYNIRTMPNAGTAAGFASAFSKGVGLAKTGASMGMMAYGDVAKVATGSIGAAGTGGMGGGDMITPDGVSEPVMTQDSGSSGGGILGVAKSQEQTNNAKIDTMAQDYATRYSKPKAKTGLPDNATPAERMSLDNASMPSSAAMQTAAFNNNLYGQGGKMSSITGKVAQTTQGNANYNHFKNGVEGSIGEIQEARDKVNDWIKGNATNSHDGVNTPETDLEAKDVYKAYGMSNDSGLKNFAPEGNAIPVTKNGQLDGFMIKGKQTNPRTGEVSDKQMYVSTGDIRKTDGKIGEHGEWTADTSGFHQITPDVYTYDVRPSAAPKGGKQSEQSAEMFEAQSNARNVATNYMDYGTHNQPMTTPGNDRSASSDVSDMVPQQPKPGEVEAKFNKSRSDAESDNQKKA